MSGTDTDQRACRPTNGMPVAAGRYLQHRAAMNLAAVPTLKGQMRLTTTPNLASMWSAQIRAVKSLKPATATTSMSGHPAARSRPPGTRWVPSRTRKPHTTDAARAIRAATNRNHA